MRLLLPLLLLATAPAPPVQVDVKTGPAAEAIHANLAGRVAEGFGGAILVERDGAKTHKGLDGNACCMHNHVQHKSCSDGGAFPLRPVSINPRPAVVP